MKYKIVEVTAPKHQVDAQVLMKIEDLESYWEFLFLEREEEKTSNMVTAKVWFKKT